MHLPTPNPVAFKLFGLDIRWYGILIAIGAALAVWISYKRAPKFGIDKEHVFDIGLICIPVGIVGARLYYVLFNPDILDGSWLNILNLRTGGLAIHGGLIFGVLSMLICCKAWKIHPLNLFDLAAPAVALAQSIGRWGNYFNQEAHGIACDLPWAIEIDGQMVHPTFLYESIWCLLLFVFLMILSNHRLFEGQIFLLYGVLYSFERFFVEGLRTDSLMLGNFRVAQLLSIAIIIVFAIWYIILFVKHKRKGRIFY